MNDFKITLNHLAEVTPDLADYTGDDGLLYCGKCCTPKQFRMTGPIMSGRLFPCPCQCEQERRDREAAEQEAQRHREAVTRLKRQGFTDPAMRDWTFANDNGKCPQMDKALFFVEHWDTMRAENIGYLL